MTHEEHKSIIYHPTDAKPISQEEWEKDVTQSMTLSGWVLDRDDETTLGFSYKTREGGHWVRDYDKKSRSFIHFDANHKVNLVQTVKDVIEGVKSE